MDRQRATLIGAVQVEILEEAAAELDREAECLDALDKVLSLGRHSVDAVAAVVIHGPEFPAVDVESWRKAITFAREFVRTIGNEMQALAADYRHRLKLLEEEGL